MERYNKLTVLETFYKVDSKNRKRKRAKVQCECGNIKECDYSSVKSGLTTSCGCVKKQNAINMSKTKKENSKNEYIGKVFKTNEGYNIKIIDYKDNHNVSIEFLDSKQFKTETTFQNIKNGQIKNPYHKTVYDLGFFGEGKYKARENNEKTKSYIKWFSMFTRCYDETYQKENPTYIGCSVCEEWHDYQSFAQWFYANDYEFEEELELDKDILINGNKEYSPKACCLVPKEINNSFNYKKDDIVYMNNIYDKYKNLLPKKVLDGIKQYTNVN